MFSNHTPPDIKLYINIIQHIGIKVKAKPIKNQKKHHKQRFCTFTINCIYLIHFMFFIRTPFRHHFSTLHKPSKPFSGNEEKVSKKDRPQAFENTPKRTNSHKPCKIRIPTKTNPKLLNIVQSQQIFQKKNRQEILSSVYSYDSILPKRVKGQCPLRFFWFFFWYQEKNLCLLFSFARKSPLSFVQAPLYECRKPSKPQRPYRKALALQKSLRLRSSNRRDCIR